MNTLKDKKKFFAQYWGQVWVNTNDFGNTDTGIWNGLYDISDCELHLTPLSKITEEVEIELMNITGLVQVKYMINSLSVVDSRYIMNCVDVANAVDYLRSRGYALPWMGVSVEDQIKYGWVKLKEL